MKTWIVAGLAIGTVALASLTPAQAQGGCGPFGHRSWSGFCRPGGQAGYGGPRPVYGLGYGYGWHRGWGPGYGWRHRGGWGY